MVYLQMNTLATRRTRKSLQASLDETPADLKGMYDATLQRLSDSDRNLAFRVFSWVFLSKRPLSKEELQCAVAIHRGSDVYDDEDLVDVQVLLSICGGLITTKRSEKWSENLDVISFVRKSCV